ncbi:MAG: hypothetical protein HC905_07755 [Bacteroidales bacterium]|nr:hypothetical protein [Bacteroidales bacterium]
MPETPLTIKQLIDKTSALEVNLLQIADNMPLEVLERHQLEEIYQYALNKGIRLEMGGRGLTPEHTLLCLNTAEAIHSPILRMVIDNQTFEPDIPQIIDIIKNLIPEFKSRKIRLAIENHDRLKSIEFEKIMNSVNSEWVGMCLDSVKFNGCRRRLRNSFRNSSSLYY